MITCAFIFLTLIALPFYVIRFTVLGLPTTLLEIILLATVAVWTFGKIHTRSFPTLPKEWRAPAILFFTASLFALLAAPQFLPALGHWRAYILEPILFALVLIDTIKTEHDRSLVAYALTASLVIPVAVALYQQLTGLSIPNEFWAASATRRVTSIYGYPNALGLYAVPILILTLGQFTKSQNHKITKITLLTLFITTMTSIIFIRSKGALLALITGIVLFFLLNAKKKFITMGMLLFIAIGGIIIFKDSINLRGFSTVQGGDSISVRLTQYRETWEMLRTHPLTGAGLRGYQTAMIPYHQQNYIEIFLYPHNIFLAMWSELGLLGLIAFLWLLFQFFKTIINQSNNKSIHYAAAASMCALLVHGLVDVPYFKNDLAVLFWILIALSMMQVQPSRQIQKNVLQ
ncbi:MAG: O-antigen ligase family protein [Patescibacteria group bacterium]